MLEPLGFWSYARHDDMRSNGRLSQLRAIVSAELEMQYGAEAKLWQDIAAVPSGPDWAQIVEQTIGKTTFFIPVVTPRYLKSESCRDEFVAFRHRAAELGRDGLIFPISYIDVKEIAPSETVFDDNLHILRKHQWMDFTHLFYAPSLSSEINRWAGLLAKRILSALRSGAALEIAKVEEKERNGHPIAINSLAKPEKKLQNAPVKIECETFPAAVTQAQSTATQPKQQWTIRQTRFPGADAPAPNGQPGATQNGRHQTAKEDPPEPAERVVARAEKTASEPLAVISHEISRMIDPVRAAEAWDRFRAGDDKAFLARIYTDRGTQMFEEIRQRYQADQDFRSAVDSYTQEFEGVLVKLQGDNIDDDLSSLYLVSDSGKVYTMLAHASGRLN